MIRRFALAVLIALFPAIASAQFAAIGPTPPTSDNGDRLATTAWVNNFFNGGLPLASGQIWIGSVGGIAVAQTPSGDWTINPAGAATLATVNANVGTFGSATQCVTVTNNAKGLTTAVSAATCTPAIGSVTGLGAGCSTFLGAPSSANLRGCLTDESGTGLAYFQGGDLGTPSAGVGTNLTALNATQLTTGTLPVARLPLTNATAQGSVTSPAGTANTTTGVMMGLGTVCKITPVYSTRVQIILVANLSNSSSAVITEPFLKFGTGTAPSNGAATTGTSVGSAHDYTTSAAGSLAPVALTGIVTGLTPATAYWFDVSLKVSAGTGTISQVDCSIMEF